MEALLAGQLEELVGVARGVGMGAGGQEEREGGGGGGEARQAMEGAAAEARELSEVRGVGVGVVSRGSRERTREGFKGLYGIRELSEVRGSGVGVGWEWCHRWA